MAKIAINGFGRIGRLAFRNILDQHPKLQVVAINDLTDSKTLAHLLKYDSSYGIYSKNVGFDAENIIIDGKKYKVFAEKDPAHLPWRKLGVDVVLECTGFFTDYEGNLKHIKAGAKKVVISAPTKDNEKVRTFVLGVNEKKYNSKKDHIISNGSCTTNCLAPLAKVLEDNFGVVHAFVGTTHSYTNSQRLLDLPAKNIREARAAALSIIPSTTGAAKAIFQTIPSLKDKISGYALRVPTPVVSIADFTAIIKKKTTIEEVNDIFRKESKKSLKGILGVSDVPLVSVDYKGNPLSAILDSELTLVQGNLVKVTAWYDNEWGYVCRLAEMAEYISSSPC
ncbi:type I glyceraldehyde-3-phosphate dehydrogenase [Patescibacteria group bacterium]|nr:type I glyceraldehyde-3-phosphate dehydrogenase [Patescibacteria group bacterium]MBU4580219.1 type I glyceraldehyde-3-phosphate dehydrogenase [Patescibacteria group bacterium]